MEADEAALQQLTLERMRLWQYAPPGATAAATATGGSNGGGSGSSLLNVETEMRRMNELLDVRKAEILKKADDAVRSQRQKLSAQKPELPSFDEPVLEEDAAAAEEVRRKAASQQEAAAAAASPAQSPSRRTTSSRAAQRAAPPLAPKPQSARQLTPRATQQRVSPRPKESGAGAPAVAPQPQRSDEEVVSASPFDMGDVDAVAESALTGESLIAFLRAKVASMQQSLAAVNSTYTDCKRRCHVLEKQTAQVTDANKALANTNQILEREVEQLTKGNSSAADMIKSHEKELTSLHKEIDAANRTVRQLEQDHSQVEAKLQRTSEELVRCRASLQEQSQDKGRVPYAKLLQENKRLETQKAELIAAFKKQLKLIDILKRQKIHLEAAKMLEISEEEFCRVLSIGEHL
eukprot:TRINITY_DN2174_c0_g1_i2.p1 TRINITY_DN2174_c0_g1~~TRINITY_DN2174_c0_g1_i2.p1  ORF type:complete len:406 (+),score=138.47 TRINITY_DN2174_c0_g1_i2:1189-2406(+)